MRWRPAGDDPDTVRHADLGGLRGDRHAARIDGLAMMVQDVLERSPYCGHLFVFRGKRADRIKVLWWDGTGLCLYAKRLERQKRWNDAMQRLLELEAELANFERQTLRTITAEQKRQILQLANDFLVSGPLQPPQRVTVSACSACIRDITVVKGPEPKLLRLHIRWQGGTTETVELHLAPNRVEAVRYLDTFVAQIRALAAMHDDDEIVALLNRDDLTSSTGKPFTVSMIRWIRYKHRIPGPSLPAGTFSVSQVRERYGVSMWVVYYWIDRGLITAQRKKPGLPYAITLTDATDHSLRDWVAKSPRLASPSPNPN